MHNKKNKLWAESRNSCLELLLDNGAKTELENDKTLWTPIHWVAYYGDETSLELLIDNNAISFKPDNKGYFPMDHAHLNKYKNVIKILIEDFIDIR